MQFKTFLCPKTHAQTCGSMWSAVQYQWFCPWGPVGATPSCARGEEEFPLSPQLLGFRCGRPFKRFPPWIPLQITFSPGFRCGRPFSPLDSASGNRFPLGFRCGRPVSPLDSAAGDHFPLGFRCGCSCQLLELLLSTLFCPNIYAPGQNKVDTLPVSLSVLTLFSCNETEPRIRRHPYSP